MDWTKPADLIDQISQHWDRGRILAAKINGAPLFPLRLRLRRPDTKALGQRFKMSVRGSEIWKMGAEQNAGLATILNGLTLTIVSWAAIEFRMENLRSQ